jgi:N-acetyl-alpha-D-glucosaminyl L-malate synthase BshA
MKIGITCYPTYGGSGVVATELGIKLAQRGHQVHFITYRWPFRLAGFQPGVSYHQVEVSTYPLFKYPPYCLALSAKMAEIAQSEGLDLLHAHYALPHATAAFMARQMISPSPKVITTLHGTDVTLVGNDPSFYRIIKFSIEASDGVTAVSEYLKGETLRQFQIKRPIQVVSNFVNTQKFRPCQDGGGKCFGKDTVLMHTSNFRPVKRIKDIVRVFAKVRQAISAKLVMIGDGPERVPAENLVRKLGLEQEVHFLGQQANVESLLPEADLFLLPSDKESFGLGALEAMSCGVPIIGCQKGGLPEVVLHGQTGFLTPVGDVEAMSEYALKILTDDVLRKEMGENARRRVLETFDAELIVPQYEEFYRQILGK